MRLSRKSRQILAGLLASLSLLAAAPVRASVRADFEFPDTDSWRHLGIVWLKPTFGLHDIGLDTNVFYSVPDPQRSYTATVSPGLLGAMRFGTRGFVTFTAVSDYVWFASFPGLSHFNYALGAKGNLNLRSLRFFGAVETQRHEERPSNEFVQRSERTNQILRAGAGYEYSERTAVDAILTRERIDYSPDFTHFLCRPDEANPGQFDCRGFELGDLLSRTETTATLRVTKRVLGRTQLFLDLSHQRLNFESENSFLDPVSFRYTNRDAAQRRLLGGFEVEPGSFLSGLVRAGLTDFRPDVVRSQKAREFVGAAALNWRLSSRILVATSLDRDLYASIDASVLAYRQRHAGLQCVYFVNRLLGFEAGYEGYRLSYPAETLVPDPAGGGRPPLFDGRRETDIRIRSGGLRFRLANRTTAVLKVAYRRRTTNVPLSEPGGVVIFDPTDRQTYLTTAVETTF